MKKMKKLKLNWKDPMVMILSCLLIFLTCGTAIAGCKGKQVVIELDAAFGGDNTGYQGIINESDFTQAVVNKLAELLNEDSHFEVLLTHAEGESSSVAERAEKINNDKPDLVLSIHADGTPDTSRSGQIIYADIPTSTSHEESLNLANAIKTAFTSDTWTPSVSYLYYEPFDDDSYQLNIVDASDTTDYALETWDLMEQVDVPVVISNQIYVTNQSDIDAWANDDGYTKAAELYYSALLEYYGIEK